MSRTGLHGELARRIHAFIDGSLAGSPPESFEALALDVHRWQAAHDAVVAALVEGPVETVEQIPAVPVSLFRDLSVGTVRPGQEGALFRTSGTTSGERGTHRLLDTALYDHGALAWAQRCVPDAPREVVALLADPADTPDSSLSHMVALFGTCSWHLRDGVLDREGLDARVRGAVGPVYVASTAFAMAEWLDHEVPPLPDDSVVMVTGGFKGREVKLDDAGLYREIERRLGPARLVTEYGMTELSSQLWGCPGEPFAPPPWLRVVAVDPTSGERVPPGTPGQLRFYDLCNLDSTVGIETLDLGIVDEQGAVALLGRLTDAPARGCSLTVEEAWSRTRTG